MRRSSSDPKGSGVAALAGAAAGVVACRVVARALAARRERREAARPDEGRFQEGFHEGDAALERSLAGREVHEPGVSRRLIARGVTEPGGPGGDDRVDPITSRKRSRSSARRGVSSPVVSEPGGPGGDDRVDPMTSRGVSGRERYEPSPVFPAAAELVDVGPEGEERGARREPPPPGIH